MPFVFDHPTALLLLLLIIPFVFIGIKATQGMSPLRRGFVLGFRALLVSSLAFALAQPSIIRKTDQITTLYVADVSASVRAFAPTDAEHISPLTDIEQWIRTTSEQRPIIDRAGVVSFQETPKLVHMHTLGPLQDLALEGTGALGTNITKALQLASSVLPPNTLGRLVLMTDGNETAGDAVLTAKELVASSDLRIDVVPLNYDISGETYVSSLEAPAIARPGQTISLRVIIESAEAMTGALLLSNSGQQIDLNPDPDLLGVPVEIPVGRSVHVVSAPVASKPINKFEVTLLPDGPDLVATNNTATAVVATPARGNMLVVTRSSNLGRGLGETLRQTDLPVTVVTPDQLTTDLLDLQSYDLIVLDDIPASAIDLKQQEYLRTYVEDFGGGLLLVGGRLSFGPGGWNNTPLEAMLPVELDPPAELRRSTGALVLVLDKSGSMQRPVGGALASQQQVANESAALAIESLLSGSWVGVVAFDQMPYQVLPMTRKSESTDLVGPVRQISTGGGTRLGPAIQMAMTMLDPIDVPEKHIVLLTDGRSDEFGLDALAREVSEKGITLTTIAVGDEADQSGLQSLSRIGGGKFHEVRNPRLLPRVLMDSVQVINTPLIKELDLSVVTRPTGSALNSSMSEAPNISGTIITAPADDPAVQIDLMDSDGDPLLAHRQFGVGRVGAFMSDSGRLWTSSWSTWDGAPVFWAQLARYLARGPAVEDLELQTRIDGEMLYVDLQAMDEDGDWLDYLTAAATLYGPRGSRQEMNLTQTAPGRYQSSLQLNSSGDYVLAISAQHGARALAPLITGVSIPPAAEYRFKKSNDQRILDIARAGKGRVLALTSPQTADVFTKDGLPERTSFGSIWPILAWICIGLMLLDVAVRRFVLIRRTSPHPSTLAAATSVERLSKTTWKIASAPRTTIVSYPAGGKETISPSEDSPPGDDVDQDASHTNDQQLSPPSEKDLHEALDKLLGKKPNAKKKLNPKPPPSAPIDEESSGTLDALRRARLRRNNRDGDQGS